MSRQLVIPAEARAQQRRASDPRISAWVSANAGAGKTHVLVQRVVRLLLAGSDPARILCLTFTKAAAANMSNRVFSTLRGWTRLDDAALAAQLAEIDGVQPSAQRLATARRLFARAIETPGGLKVETIHAFCTRILHLFPFEAGVAARFEVLDERTLADLIDGLRADLLLRAGQSPDSALGRAVARLALENADSTLTERIAEGLSRRWDLAAWIGGRPIDDVIAELAAAFDVGPEEAPEQLARSIMDSPHLQRSEWASVAATFRQMEGARDHQQGEALLMALQGIEASWISVFLNKDRVAKKKGWLYSSQMEKEHPALVARLIREAARLEGLHKRIAAAALVQRTRAIVTIVLDIHRKLEARKAAAGLLDFDDLVTRTTRLLAAERAQWVHYKLDQGIDHVLVDEAQDTSPEQWEVIERLTNEFAVGASARSQERSLFVVGDEKQSIYSFQGADPRYFSQMQQMFSRRFADAGKALEAIPIRWSFRSTQTVVGAVDVVFRPEHAFKGLESLDPKPPVHEALRQDTPGEVEIWPLVQAEKRGERLAWTAPFDAIDDDDPPQVLAKRIADTIQHWLASGQRLGPGKPAIRPKDVLILVRQRGGFFNAIIRALQLNGVPVAGADRLRLLESIAIEDMLSLIGALLTPDDDLALAEALKSPVFGLTEAQLFGLAHGRSGRLARQLDAATDPQIARVAGRLRLWRDMALRLGPFEFLAQLLGPQGVRKAMVARLGPEADDALDELVVLAVQFEAAHPPTLRGFLRWLVATDIEIKRDMDAERDEVRVMTVHGAKGLEAPIVILPDTTTKPEGGRTSPFLPVQLPGQNTPAALVWTGKDTKDFDPIKDALARRSADTGDEHRRLLYVALTRAADRLVICGKAPRGQKAPEGCWYELVRAALCPSAASLEPAEAFEGDVWRWTADGKPPVRDYVTPTATIPGTITANDATPGDLDIPASAERLTPSAHRKPAIPTGIPADGIDPRLRGELIHRLLQAFEAAPDAAMLAGLEPALQRLAPDLPAVGHAAMAREIRQLFDHAGIRALFAGGDLREASVAGRIMFEGREVEVSGRIDRLRVEAERITIVDFKTDRAPPSDAHGIPEAYRRQMSLYGALLAEIYPGRKVASVLVWSANACLTWLE